MGRLIAAADWSKTPLGPIEAWPQVLRTTVGLCLATKFPLSLTWGPTNVTIYNDSYLPICGQKHPASLGQDYSAIWAAAWPWLGEAFASALAGAPAFLENQRIFLDRHGFLEETFFTFSFSPVRDDDGHVCGVFNPAAETTVPNLGERRTRALRDVTMSTASAKTVEEVFALATETLARYDLDLPFVLLYTLDRESGALHLAGSTGLSEGARAAPSVLAVDEPGAHSWPMATIMSTRNATEIHDVAERFGAIQCGPYPESPRIAMALPIAAPGSEQPSAVVIAGVSSRLELNDAYRDFYDLLSGAITAALVNARAYEEERTRAEALAAIDRAKTTFFSNVSHEFRTPLTLILGPIEDAASSRDRALRAPDVEIVRRNALRLLKLVNTLLDFSRIEAGRAEASYEPTELCSLTKDLSSVFRSTIERSGLTFDVECRPLREPVFVDRDMWEKIVLNLLSNAVKFTFEGGISVALRDAGDHAELEVRDTGDGIPEHELPRVFERFHRIEGTRARTHEGSGIGLALVHELVRLHGGSVRVTSAVGKGTTFTVSVPFGTAHLPQDRIGAARVLASTAARADAYVEEAFRWLASPDHERSNVATSATTPRVLVADDNADMRDYVARLLEEHWTVETAPDGVQALQMVRDNPPDLILADVMMPNLDGFGLLREMRANPRTAAIPFVMLSARAGEESRIEGVTAGADDYLVKPFSARELVARVAAQLARRQAELQREDLAKLLTLAPTPVVILRGSEYVIELANDETCKLWGRMREEVIGRRLFDALPEVRDQIFRSLLDGVMTTGVPYTGRNVVASLDRRRNGKCEDVYLNFAYTPLRNLSGDVDGVLVIASDVTDSVRAHEEMTRLRDAAESASHAKDEFLAMLAHELRNPLAPLQTSVELMRRRVPALVDHQLDVIERQAKNLTRIVDDLLEVSRVTQGKIELRRERLDLGKAVSMAIESARELLDARRHDVSISLPMRPVCVLADPVRLDQIIVNLVNNAAKYTNTGGKIAVSLESNGKIAELRVRDNGIGIPEDLRPRIFELFQQGSRDLSRAQGGLGIGLSIVRRLVELHGGEVEASSEGAGRGSELVVRLPVAGEAQEAAATPLPDPSLAAHQPGHLRILVVDDNLDAAECLAALIEDLGHETRTALDGSRALQLTEEWHPELTFLDIGLPGMDGYEVARELRRRNPTQPYLVALTGYGQESDRRKAREAGFDQHLVKPPHFETIEAIIDRLGKDLSATVH